MNLGTLLPRHARYRPNHLALVFGDQRLTFNQLHQRVNALSNALKGLGLGQGDKIATILPNCPEQLEVFWAVAALGAVVVPLSPLLRGAALTRLLNDADARAIITTDAFAETLNAIRADLPQVEPERYLLTDSSARSGYQSYQALTAAASTEPPPPVAISPDDPYNIMYSSGTTGLPKGIVHTHAIRMAYCTSFASAYRFTPESVVLHAGSLVFNGAFLTLMPALFLGCTYVLQAGFDPVAFIEAIAREKVTHVMMVPSQIIAMLHAPNFSAANLNSLEMICSVGAPLHLEHKEALSAELPGRFHELYGLTEGFVTILDKNDYPAKPGSVGVPPPFFEMRIERPDGSQADQGEVGEIVGRGPILMPGYYKRPDLTDQAVVDGWLHSGDLGYVDEDGFLFLVDRQKDLIISGGVNVYPRDIEEVAVQHPAVREAAVFGIPSHKWGETPVAAVILRQPGAVSAEALKSWINERVGARYQRVHQVIVRDAFPRSVAGKTLKRVMRQPFWDDQNTQI
ncbi:MAG: class I adenylate-forming enzyme family protein [Candidatus Promineifilaceae bacterium]|nr:class I adenylate-forming enzyme family protein [Candidatus Promineifilaceae bacterium]